MGVNRFPGRCPVQRLSASAGPQQEQSARGTEWGRMNLAQTAQGAAFDTPGWLCYFAKMKLQGYGYTEQAKERFLLGAAFVLSTLLVGCGRDSSNQASQAAQNVIEAEAYKSKIEVSKVGLAKGENYLGSE